MGRQGVAAQLEVAFLQFLWIEAVAVVLLQTQKLSA
jgi:hypothetical protein